MRKLAGLVAVLTLVVLCGCSRLRVSGEQPDRVEGVTVDVVTVGTRVTEVMDDSVLGEAGRLLFPVEDWYWRGDTLGNLSYTWYAQLDARTTVDVVNRLRAGRSPNTSESVSPPPE